MHLETAMEQKGDGVGYPVNSNKLLQTQWSVLWSDSLQVSNANQNHLCEASIFYGGFLG